MMADHSRLALVMEDDPKQIALNEIVSSLSHDFRAPLRRVRQFLALIERKHGADFDPETTTWLEFINENTHRMQLMIDSLTELKDVAHFEGETQVVDLQTLVDELLKSLNNFMAEADAIVTVAANLPRLETIPELLSLLIHKLIQHAIQQQTETNQKPIIHLKFEIEGKHAVLHIQDNGPGIEAELLPNALELFNEINTADAKSTDAIGLAVCRHIAARLGTNLKVTSTAGVGSDFAIKLPLA
ncbi:MAG: sensor histidine kinase [Pseudomonadales bacterium]